MRLAAVALIVGIYANGACLAEAAPDHEEFMTTIASVSCPKSNDGSLKILSDEEEEGYQPIIEILYRNGKLISAKAGILLADGTIDYWASLTARKQWFVGTGESALTEFGQRFLASFSKIGESVLKKYCGH